jgi:hypothetical protein
MIKMPVNHGFSPLSFKSAIIPTHPVGGVNSGQKRLARPNIIWDIEYGQAGLLAAPELWRRRVL